MRFPANGFWAFCQTARPAPPIGFLTTPPPALAWFPLVWPGFDPPQGDFPANARAARARARGDLWQPTAVPVVFPEPTLSPNPKPQAHSTGDDGFKLTAC